jgi:hypothetical protein
MDKKRADHWLVLSCFFTCVPVTLRQDARNSTLSVFCQKQHPVICVATAHM